MRKTLSAVALATTLALTGCSVFSGQSSTGQYVDDATITTRVKSRLANDPKASATRISVETLNGVVQLSGFATSAQEKQEAVEIARGVPDVKGVRDSIIVRPPQQ
jgi:osmotically-inducible protein OsmY